MSNILRISAPWLPRRLAPRFQPSRGPLAPLQARAPAAAPATPAPGADALHALHAGTQGLLRRLRLAETRWLPASLRRMLARPSPAAYVRLGEAAEAALSAGTLDWDSYGAVRAVAELLAALPPPATRSRSGQAALYAAQSRIVDGERRALVRIAAGEAGAEGRQLARAIGRDTLSVEVRAAAQRLVGRRAAPSAARPPALLPAAKDSGRRHLLMPAPRGSYGRALWAQLRGRSAPGEGPALLYTSEGTFTIGRTIAHGSFGKFRMARDPEGRLVGLKELRTAPARRPDTAKTRVTARDAALEELRVLQEVGSPLYSGRHFDVDGKLYLVTPLLAGDLHDLAAGAVGRRDGMAREALRAVAADLARAHAQGYVHRDIKPANVLFDGAGRLVLSDYGLAARPAAGADHVEGGYKFGTAVHMAPEALYGSQRSTAASDVWSLGSLFVSLVTDALLVPGGDNIEAHFEAVWDFLGKLPRTALGRLDLAALGASASPVARRLAALWQLDEPVVRFVLTRMLARRPEQRPTAQEVAAFFEAGPGAASAAQRASFGRLAARQAGMAQRRLDPGPLAALATRRARGGWRPVAAAETAPEPKAERGLP